MAVVGQLIMDKDGNVRVVNGKSPPQKGAGKGGGKGSASPSPKGNGKGKDNAQKSYYFDVFPERARGRKVVKCPKDGCFGCCLDGDNRPEACNKCQTSFNYCNSRASSAGSERVKADPKAQPKVEHENNETFYSRMEEQGYSHETIIEMFAHMGKKYKPKAKATTSVAALAEGIAAVQRLDKEQRRLDGLLTHQWNRHETLLNNIKECEEKIKDLAEQKIEVVKETQIWMEKSTKANNIASVASAAAQGCDDNTHEMMQAFQEKSSRLFLKSIKTPSSNAAMI